MRSYTAFDVDLVEPVSVLASFDTVGKISPVFVRINEYSCKILSFWILKKFGSSTDFNCTVEYANQKLPIRLTYYDSEHVWVMPKMER